MAESAGQRASSSARLRNFACKSSLKVLCLRPGAKHDAGQRDARSESRSTFGRLQIGPKVERFGLELQHVAWAQRSVGRSSDFRISCAIVPLVGIAHSHSQTTTREKRREGIGNETLNRPAEVQVAVGRGIVVNPKTETCAPWDQDHLNARPPRPLTLLGISVQETNEEPPI